MSAWASPGRTSATAAAAIASPSACRIAKPSRSIPLASAIARIRGSGPTRIGRTQPRSAAIRSASSTVGIVAAGHGHAHRLGPGVGVVDTGGRIRRAASVQLPAIGADASAGRPRSPPGHRDRRAFSVMIGNGPFVGVGLVESFELVERLLAGPDDQRAHGDDRVGQRLDRRNRAPRPARRD